MSYRDIHVTQIYWCCRLIEVRWMHSHPCAHTHTHPQHTHTHSLRPHTHSFHTLTPSLHTHSPSTHSLPPSTHPLPPSTHSLPPSTHSPLLPHTHLPKHLLEEVREYTFLQSLGDFTRPVGLTASNHNLPRPLQDPLCSGDLCVCVCVCVYNEP